MTDRLDQFGKHLSDAQKLRRKIFMSNYIINFNGKEAAKAAGFSSSAIYKKLLKEAYTRELQRVMLNKLEKDNIISANEIRFLAKKEAMDEELGTSTSRVQAIKLLHEITKDDVEEAEVQPIMVMPQVVSVDEWSDAAEKMQKELKNRVMESNRNDNE